MSKICSDCLRLHLLVCQYATVAEICGKT